MAAVPCVQASWKRCSSLSLIPSSLSHPPTGPSTLGVTDAIPTKAGKHLSKVLELRKRKHGWCPAAGGLDTKLMQELMRVKKRFFMFTHLLPRESIMGFYHLLSSKISPVPSETLRKGHTERTPALIQVPKPPSSIKKHHVTPSSTKMCCRQKCPHISQSCL